MSTSPIKDVVARYTRQWLAIEGVVGTAEGRHEGEPCVLVFVAEMTPDLRDKIPSVVEGYPVVIKRTGKFHLL